MIEKDVENIHRKPRGKDQCSPEQTCPEVPPYFVSVFILLVRIIVYSTFFFFLLLDVTANKVIQASLPALTCLYVIFLTVKQEDVVTAVLKSHSLPARQQL